MTVLRNPLDRVHDRTRAMFTLLALTLGTSACTTLTPVEMPPEQVQQKILHEDILVPGKRAKIVTADGRVRSVTVLGVSADQGIIETKEEPVVVADIVALETREFSIGKTTLLAAGAYTYLALLAVALGPALVL